MSVISMETAGCFQGCDVRLREDIDCHGPHAPVPGFTCRVGVVWAQAGLFERERAAASGGGLWERQEPAPHGRRGGGGGVARGEQEQQGKPGQ
jgi:hypothetical protein